MNKNTPPEQSTTESEITALVNENSRLLCELTTTTQEVENLRASLYGQHRTVPNASKETENNLAKQIQLMEGRSTEQRQKIAQLERNLKATRRSYSFRIGHTLVCAIAKPGTNTIKAPLHLIKLSWQFLRSRDRARKNI